MNEARLLWEKVAGIGNVLRHNYESIAAPVIWKLVQADLPLLKKVCREELATELSGNSAVDRGRAPKLNQSRRKLSMQDSSGLILSMPPIEHRPASQSEQKPGPARRTR